MSEIVKGFGYALGAMFALLAFTGLIALMMAFIWKMWIIITERRIK